MDAQAQLHDYVRMAKNEGPGHFIRQWRKHRGLTLEQLAERLRTTHATLSRIERGKMAYNQPLLERLADELRTDSASLIVRDPMDPEGIWTLWDSLTPHQQRQGVELLKVIQGENTGTVDR
jgi:transcriptional regulator with XRE-family HTH domain